MYKAQDVEVAWEELANFEALLTAEQVDAQEHDSWEASRHMMLMTLTKSSKQLLNSCKLPDAINDKIKSIDAYKGHLLSLLELTESSHSRLLVIANVSADREQSKPNQAVMASYLDGFGMPSMDESEICNVLNGINELHLKIKEDDLEGNFNVIKNAGFSKKQLLALAAGLATQRAQMLGRLNCEMPLAIEAKTMIAIASNEELHDIDIKDIADGKIPIEKIYAYIGYNPALDSSNDPDFRPHDDFVTFKAADKLMVRKRSKVARDSVINGRHAKSQTTKDWKVIRKWHDMRETCQLPKGQKFSTNTDFADHLIKLTGTTLKQKTITDTMREWRKQQVRAKIQANFDLKKHPFTTN